MTQVEIYSSFTYAVEPRAFVYAGERRRVCCIMRAWREPGRIYFYVRDDDARLFELTFDESLDVWLIRAFGENYLRP